MYMLEVDNFESLMKVGWKVTVHVMGFLEKEQLHAL